jgi:hypothetical protein
VLHVLCCQCCNEIGPDVSHNMTPVILYERHTQDLHLNLRSTNIYIYIYIYIGVNNIQILASGQGLTFHEEKFCTSRIAMWKSYPYAEGIVLTDRSLPEPVCHRREEYYIRRICTL